MKYTRKKKGAKGTLLNQEFDQEAEGMSIEALAKSRDKRIKFFKKYELDHVPESILVNDLKDKAIDQVCDDKAGKKKPKGRSANKTGNDYVKMRGKRGSKIDTDLYDKDVRDVFKTQKSGSRKGSLSKFPQNICRDLVRFHCPKGGTIVDLFAGHNSRMQACYETQRNYIGIDVSHDFMKVNREIRDFLLKENKRALIKNPATIQLIERSSDDTGLPDECGDFSITSPPYGFKGGIEFYGNEPEQLGKAKTYEDFLKNISKHIIENARVLKDQAYCCWCINDFVMNGIFYPYHSDLIPLFRDAGFRLHYIYIIDLGATIQTVFTQRIHEWKTFPKRHEYCMVFQKSGQEERIIDYSDEELSG